MAGILETQNQEWSQNESRFGFQMLQKMGWSEGKGLGKNEDGSVKPIVFRRKLDSSGIGSEKKPSDVWKNGGEMSSSFSDLLSNLGSVGSEPKSTKRERQKGSQKSKSASFLERRKSGKNVKLYSRKELSEIFGSKESVFDSLATSSSSVAQVNGNDETMEKAKLKKSSRTTKSKSKTKSVKTIEKKKSSSWKAKRTKV
ncbi:hypothetical protein NDN08_006512 [Rhodosorus marinus]|uniref:G-patch domain-containing protein n=1 Tax=Rhodosorus marinus TaxID=101924 RepID=A0AAV8UHZ3_9RHOD|nr:hypothetical protein NDN08_006512 [Rhodosorus marinus]